MKLEFLNYIQHKNTPDEWSIKNFSFSDVNLIVGKNASGKTRSLNVINSLALLLSGELKILGSGKYETIFKEADQDIRYNLHIEDYKILEEKLEYGKDLVLNRWENGKGEIYAEELKKTIKFQVPDRDIACVTKRDLIQHPFLEKLYEWASSLLHYKFGTALGKKNFAIFVKGQKEANINLRDTNAVVGIFKRGKDKYGEKFIDCIKTDMKLVGYEIDNLYIGTVKQDVMSGLIAKEHELDGKVDQENMSQGMFRALSLLIQLNFAFLENFPSCILIDDIGEGLDFERASALIKLLVNKAKQSNIQLIMSTNDRFVMNNVSLEHWSIFHRLPSKSIVYNYQNSKEQFDDFELTGLSNFDFFTSNFYQESS